MHSVTTQPYVSTTTSAAASPARHSVWGTSIRYTILMTLIFGIGYPLLVTGIAGVLFPHRAAGSLILKNGQVIGSELIAQSFTADKYFHPRPSAAGNGYDAANSGGTYLGPTNQKLIDRVRTDAASLQQENPGQPVPVDLITTSASGLDPDISPAAAEFQVPRVARARGLSESTVRDLVQKHTRQRDLGLLGEPRVNVLELNLALDEVGTKN